MIRPIILNGPEVRAVLDGRKTHHCVILKPSAGAQSKWLTAEILNKSPTCYLCEVDGRLGVQMQHPKAGTAGVDPMSPLTWVALPFAPGDKLWVREAHSLHHAHGRHVTPGREDHGERWGPWSGLPIAVSPDKMQVAYYREGFDRSGPPRWRSAPQMPRWASRAALTVEAVRVFRVQEITEAEAIAEGCPGFYSPAHPDHGVTDGQMPHEEFRDRWNARHGADAWDRNAWVAGLTFTAHRCNVDQMP